MRGRGHALSGPRTSAQLRCHPVRHRRGRRARAPRKRPALLHPLRLVLDGVSYTGLVFVNGNFIGGHHGGFSRWSLDLDDALNCGEENTIAIRVDNRRAFDQLPPLTRPDGALRWWFYGGIHREAVIEAGPEITLAKLAVETDHQGGLKGAGALYNHSRASVRAHVTVRVRELSGELKAEVMSKEVEFKADLAAFRFESIIPDVKPWSTVDPGNRYLLEVVVSSGSGDETQSIEIGFRTFEFRGTKPYLNGKPIFLRGVNRHEDYPESGPVLTDARIDEDMGLIHQLHVNFMRPGHYPNDPRWLDACDREGILITHEIPLYQTGSSTQSILAVAGERLYNDAARQLAEMIERDRNHPSVVMWSIGNENRTYQPGVKRLHQKLYDAAKRFDPSRPVTFAVTSDPNMSPHFEITAGIADVIFINEYFGWSRGEPADLGPYLDKVHAKWPDKPLVMSEFGAGALKGRAPGELVSVGSMSREFTEEYQVEFYRQQLAQMRARDYICGIMPWLLADFRDDGMDRNPRQHFNLKGVVTYEREKKAVFGVLAGVYAEIEREYGW